MAGNGFGKRNLKTASSVCVRKYRSVQFTKKTFFLIFDFTEKKMHLVKFKEIMNIYKILLLIHYQSLHLKTTESDLFPRPFRLKDSKCIFVVKISGWGEFSSFPIEK